MVVVDSSVLISLCRIGELNLLKRFFGKIKITREIYDEIIKGEIGVSEIDKARDDWIIISEYKDNSLIEKTSNLEKIEKADASIILFAEKNSEILLSNDYALIIVARIKGIECWWITTFLLKCLKKKIITREKTKEILFNLIKAGMRLSNVVYAEVLKEIDKI